MVLQNFVDERQVHALNAAHDVSGSDSIDHTHYPLTVVVTPGATVNVKFEFHPHLVTARRAEDLLRHFVDLLQSWSQDMAGSVVASPVPAVAQQTQIRGCRSAPLPTCSKKSRRRNRTTRHSCSGSAG
ncbi:hypothetical protein ACETU7_28845 [Rhodococcus sp. 3Y1]